MRISPKMALQASLLACKAAANPMIHSITNLQVRTADACNSLYSALPDQVYYSNTTIYANETTQFWNADCVYAPSCVFEPKSAQAMGQGVKLIKAANARFSLRSGGHMPIPGANSIEEGVLISTRALNTKTFMTTDKSVAGIGPGQQWVEVYSWLQQNGLAVNGGKVKDVGVGGYLMGGGIGYFSGNYGWGCDSIVGYEVVLPDGCVAYVTNSTSTNGTDYSDLFWALRGGHNNFAIVTRFDMATFPIGRTYGGVTVWAPDAANAWLSAFANYMADDGGIVDPSTSVDPTIQVTPANGSSSISYSVDVIHPQDNVPSAISNWTAISNSTVVLSQATIYDDWTQILPGDNAPQTRHLFYEVCYKGTLEALTFQRDAIINGSLNELSGLSGLTIASAWSPIGKTWAESSVRNGGDALGLDPEIDGNFVAGRIEAHWYDESQNDQIYDFVERTMASVEDKVKQLGIHNPIIYLNEAFITQKPYPTLGHGNSLPRLLNIQSKYDPDGFIKNNLNHGFPLEY
ncbi:FAD binding domain protein [Xylariaceae sp. FL0016]|nr:FAD binding domain protein [Xylariaceae sp. FL0016]